MGICASCESTAVAATAKLILNDGSLLEYPFPVKASYISQMDPACFICNSDEIGFNDVVSAIGDDEELRIGELYFSLPLSRLRRCFLPEEIAALAVKASVALANGGGNHKCSLGSRRRLVPYAALSGTEKDGAEDNRIRRRNRRRRRASTGTMLTIPE